VAGAVATARLYGLGADYVQNYRLRLGAVTAPEAQAAARTVVRPDQAVIVVVGDGTKIHDKLTQFAPVRIVDPTGKPLTVDDLTPKAAELDLDLAALVPRRDSFAIIGQGVELGWLRGVFERSDSGFRYVEDTRIANFVNQTTTLELDSKAGMRSVKQSGTVQGFQASIDVTFSGNHARGNASVPTQEGIKNVAIDTTLAPGTLDDNAIQALLPAFRWKPDGKWTFTVLSSGQGEIHTVTLSVTGTESLTVGSQTVECYRAEAVGLASPVTFLVTTAAPHRLMKILVAGTPIEMIRR
jgi:hypothetical protein